MMRAMRRVVDTGIHAKGWTRDQAIAYMLANSSMGRTDATAEVERYIAYPGQALSYKVGQITIRRLRDRAEAARGARFDIRAFHDQLLTTGPLPMEILDGMSVGPGKSVSVRVDGRGRRSFKKYKTKKKI